MVSLKKKDKNITKRPFVQTEHKQTSETSSKKKDMCIFNPLVSKISELERLS